MERSAFRSAASMGEPLGLGSRTLKQGTRMSAAQAAIASLEAEGVEYVFGYPGAQAIAMYDALYDSREITHVLARHEQGAVHMADGYARSTGRPGVVMVTSGPGATNTVTGIATAYMDSVPLVVVCGQVERGVIGTDFFQESDIVGITMPIVKHSFLLQSAADLPRTFREAFHIASTGRPGPVLIDIPSDVAREQITFNYSDSVQLPSYKPTYRGNARQVRAACALLRECARPVVLAGGGVVSSEATDELVALMEMLRIPAVTTLMGKCALPSDHPLNLGPVGMYGSRYANLALTRSDLIIVAGARFSDRVTGDVSSFAPDAKVIHIDIDPAEIGKIRDAQVPIVGDLQSVLGALNALLQADVPQDRTGSWLAQIDEWKLRYPLHEEGADRDADSSAEIAPERVMRELSRQLERVEGIVTTEVGQHQMWANQLIARRAPRTFLTSGGLGTMGFGFPAAIGAAIGNPDKVVVCVAGDGSFQMNVQEMATAAAGGVPVKVLIIDNRCLGMVHQLQRLFFDGRYSATLLEPNPDFVKLAEAYSWQAERVVEPSDLAPAIERMLSSDGPYLLDVVISRDRCVYPMVAPGGSIDESLGAEEVLSGDMVRGGTS